MKNKLAIAVKKLLDNSEPTGDHLNRWRVRGKDLESLQKLLRSLHGV